MFKSLWNFHITIAYENGNVTGNWYETFTINLVGSVLLDWFFFAIYRIIAMGTRSSNPLDGVYIVTSF